MDKNTIHLQYINAAFEYSNTIQWLIKCNKPLNIKLRIYYARTQEYFDLINQINTELKKALDIDNKRFA